MGEIRNSRKADGTRYTGDEWRAMAKEAHRRSVESFERSDTDGFLSQWASDLSAQELNLWGQLADAGYVWEFSALFDLDGNLLDAREVETQYGYSWAIRNADGSTSWFNASKARKAATRFKNDTAKGYRVGIVSQAAFVVMAGGKGGYMSVRPVVRPIKDAERTVVDTGTAGEGDYATDW